MASCEWSASVSERSRTCERSKSVGTEEATNLISSNHLDLDAERERIVDRLLGVLTRGVEDREQADELEASERSERKEKQHPSVPSQKQNK